MIVYFDRLIANFQRNRFFLKRFWLLLQAMLFLLSSCMLTSCSTSPEPARKAFNEIDGRIREEHPIKEFKSAGCPISQYLTKNSLLALSKNVAGYANTNQYTLPPPLLQLPQQQAAREEIEQSGVSATLVKKMLAGQVLSVAEVQELTRKRVSDATIMKYLRSTGAVYFLRADQIGQLQADFASNALIDYLLSTAVRQRTPGYGSIYLPAYSSPLYDSWSHHHHHRIGIYHDLHHHSHH